MKEETVDESLLNKITKIKWYSLTVTSVLYFISIWLAEGDIHLIDSDFN